MKQKKLLIITENYVSGGANKYIEDVVSCLDEEFNQIEIWGNDKALIAFNKERLSQKIAFQVVAIFNSGELTKNAPVFLKKILKSILIPLFFILNVISLLILKLRVQLLSPDKIILCNGGYPASTYLDMACFFLKKHEVFMTIVSTPFRRESFPINYIWKILDKIVSSSCKKIVVNSKAIESEMINRYHFSPNLLSVLRNGVVDEYKPRFFKTEGSLKIGFISRLEKSKGLEELISAYQMIKEKNNHLELIIAGTGSLEEKVKNISRRDASVKYLGHLSSGITDLLHEIDIFVLPSYQEGLPYSIIEACMAECAIVASNVGGIPELITNNVSGILINPQSSDELSKALQKIIATPEMRRSLSKNARINFLNMLSIDKMKTEAKKIFF